MMMLLSVLSAATVAVALPALEPRWHDSWGLPKNLIVFGDSYSDNCNTWRLSNDTEARNAKYPFPSCPPAPTGRAGGGPSWAEQVANTTDINVVNYAYSAATCSNVLFPRYADQLNNVTALIPAVEDQIDIWQNNTDTFLPVDTAIAIFIGTNDLTFFTGRFHPNPEIDILPKGVILNDEVDCVLEQVARLRKLGYYRITVMNNIPLERTQLFSANSTQGYGYKIKQDGPFVADTMAGLVGANNRMIKDALIRNYAGTSGVSIFPTHQLYHEQFESPAKYGYTKPVSSFCEICPGETGSSGECTACDDPDAHIFWDQLHPGVAAQAVLAEHMISFLKDPASL
ncbi:hypothetical protein RQP46_005253 [Phenoliferia psychrophenolica]